MNQQETTSFTPIEESDIDTSVPARFEEQARKYPDKIAIKEETHSITYSELNKKANQLAHEILSLNGDSSVPIIISIEFGIPAFIAIMGVLKTGRPYVMVDPSHPHERIADIVYDSRSHLIVTDSTNLELTLAYVESFEEKKKFQKINIDEIKETVSIENPGVSISPRQTAMLIYTSGSTGKPKGVMRPHNALLSNLRNNTNRHKIDSSDRFLLISSLTFAGSGSSVYYSLLNGASVHPFRIKDRSFSQLSDWVTQEKITIYVSVPTTFRHFAQTLTGEGNFPDLRLIRLGGEAIYKHDVALFKKHFSDSCIMQVGLAGTETGGICYNAIDKDANISTEIVPVGRPVEHVEVLLLDDEQKPVSPGEIGEIAVRSRYLPLGYWRRPDLNKEKYLPDPDGGDRRICLTGDIGRFLPDGTLEHISRKDTMVKIRGLRIEIKEIEATLLGSDLVKDTAVLAQDDRFKEKRLVAYIVPSGDVQPSIITLREFVAQKLPDYMIPSTFVFLDSLPKTTSGKINRLALSEPPKGRLISGQDYIAPRNETENKLVQIYEKFLDVQPVGIKDDFFELGGHSLVAIQIITKIEEKLHKSIPMNDFIKALTVEKIAQSLQTQSHRPSFLYLVDFRTSGPKPPLFFVPPAGTTAMRFEKLIKYLGDDQPVYSFEYAGMDGKTEPFTTVQFMAQAFNQELRVIQPEGPYFICGMCFGGIVAYEMAQQLSKLDQKVAFLGVLDASFGPNQKFPFWMFIYLQLIKLNDKFLNLPMPMGHIGLEARLNRENLTPDAAERITEVFKSSTYARFKYVSPLYPGLITYFSSGRGLSKRFRMRWQKATSVEMDIQPIPGYHASNIPGQSSFIQEPNVQVLAQLLNENLEKARLNADSI